MRTGPRRPLRLLLPSWRHTTWNATIMAMVRRCLVQLNCFLTDLLFDSTASDANREELWHKMHDIFADIPNYILWNNLLAMKDRQLVEIGVMSRMNIANLLKVSDGPTGSASTQSTASSYKIAIGKMYALHVSLMVDMHLGKMEKQKLVTDYVMAYNTFESNIQTKYELFNKNEVAHELLVAYVTQFSTMCYNQAQIEYLERAIAENDNEIMERTEALKDHSALTNSYRCICNEIEDLYCKTQEDMRSLSSVKDKIKVNEDYLRYLIEKQNDMDAVKILGTAAGNTNEPANSSSSNFGSDESFTSNVTLDSTGNRYVNHHIRNIFIHSFFIIPLPDLMSSLAARKAPCPFRNCSRSSKCS